MRKPIHPLRFFSGLKWLDGERLVIEPYRSQTLERGLFTFPRAFELATGDTPNEAAERAWLPPMDDRRCSGHRGWLSISSRRRSGVKAPMCSNTSPMK
jgi:hypothetical protein